MHTDVITSLENETQQLLARLDSHPHARKLFEGTVEAEAYAAYLIQSFHYVRWTRPLLERAGRRLAAGGQHPVLAGLLIQKAREESGHERWLLADLKALGWSASVVEHTPPCPAVAAYVAWNRYTVEAGVPLAFLGTAYVLESLSVHRAGEAVHHLLERSGIPNIHRAVTFLRGHAGADVGHVAELAATLGSLSDMRECEAVVLSARNTCALYPDLFTPEALRVDRGACAR